MARNKFTKEEHLMKMEQARSEPVQQPMGAGGQPAQNPDIQRLMAAAQKHRAELSEKTQHARPIEGAESSSPMIKGRLQG